MDVNFVFNEAAAATPIYIEQVFAEKPAGGMVANPDADYPPSTAVYYDSNDKLFHCIAKETTSPAGTPVYVLGTPVFAGKGDQPARLINGANLRKETANLSSEVAALLPNITLV